MKQSFSLLIVMVGGLTLTACSSPSENAAKAIAVSPSPSPTENVEQVIMKLEQEWADAALKNDIAAFERIEADDWVYFTAEGRIVNKAQDLAESKANAYKATTLTISEVKVRVYGDTAVATLVQDEKSQYKGKDTSGHYLFTDVWVKKNGKWQVVSTQGTKVEPPKK